MTGRALAAHHYTVGAAISKQKHNEDAGGHYFCALYLKPEY